MTLPVQSQSPLGSMPAADGYRRWRAAARGAELSYDRVSGIYRAPVQTLANGGVLVVDDFGRQQCSPRELLNRSIVPLESRVDILTLQSGQKVELPFMVLVAFATNLRPADLVDEAFLRRIQFKIFAQNPTVDEFATIFENCCRERNLRFDRQLVERLLTQRFSTRGIPLRGCQPRDLHRARSGAGGVPRPAA